MNLWLKYKCKLSERKRNWIYQFRTSYLEINYPLSHAMLGLSAILGSLPEHPHSLCQSKYTLPGAMHSNVPASSCHSWRANVVLPSGTATGKCELGVHGTVTAGLPSHSQVATSAEVILTWAFSFYGFILSGSKWDRRKAKPENHNK